MSNKRRVKIIKNEEENTLLVPYYDRDKEIELFNKSKKKKEAIKIPSVKDLYDVREEYKRKREEIYEKILEDIIFEIKELNMDNEIQCQYSIPLEILHKPIYVFEECVWYITNKLRKDGKMFVVFYKPNVLFISWKVKVGK